VLRFRGGRMTAGEIAERFGCTWPTTSRHLGVLKRAGLVVDERRGRERVYRVADERLREVTRDFTRWFEGESPETASRRVSSLDAAARRRGARPRRAGRRRDERDQIDDPTATDDPAARVMRVATRSGAVRLAARADADDEVLLERIAGGDREALAELARRYHGRFFRVARRMLGNDHDAEDGVQLTFLKIHQHAGEFCAHWRGSTWLYRILTNVCIDAWRKRARERIEVDVDVAASGAPAVERLDVQAALAKLPAETRAVLLLRHLEDLSYEEVARVRGVSVNTIKTQLRRGKQALRRHLEEGP
jgi:RNA polymerase sigma-70 factor (ECF subfamily)